jgi:hypothetical protein
MTVRPYAAATVNASRAQKTRAIGEFAEWQRGRRSAHVVSLPGSALVERECRRTAARVAMFCAGMEDDLGRFKALLQCEDEAMARWVAHTPGSRLRAIWKAPRDRLKVRSVMRRARNAPTASTLADLVLRRA